MDDANQQQWLTLRVHGPAGRPSRINELRLVEPARSARRTRRLIQQYYGRSLHWPLLASIVEPIVDLIADETPVAVVAEASTSAMLGALGWRGKTVHSSQLEARPERSARLADLAAAVGAQEYLCGTGGTRYLDPAAFHERGISVQNVDFNEAELLGPHHVTALRAIGLLGEAKEFVIRPRNLDASESDETPRLAGDFVSQQFRSGQIVQTLGGVSAGSSHVRW